MKKQYARKGFTITELVIVIAVIAILAAVLIPTFSDVVEKANKSSDLQKLRNAYTIVEAEKALKGSGLTKDEALTALAESGISSLELSSSDYAVYWDPANTNFALYDNEKNAVVLPKEGTKTDAWELVQGDEVPEVSQPATQPSEENDPSGETTAPSTIAVTGVTLNKSSATLDVGETDTLVATVAPADATNQNLTWSSDNEAVATVNNGVVTVVGAGTATVTVTTEDGGFTATYTLTARVNALKAAIDTTGAIYNGTGWKTGYRLGSSGGESAIDGKEVTGFINVEGKNVVTLENIYVEAGSEANHAYCYIAFYDKNFNLISGCCLYAKAWINNFPAAFGDFETVKVDDDRTNLVEFELKGLESNSAPKPINEAVYMRISAVDINADSAIYLD